ncbi:hypothetical protein DICVIV_08410 [Dictyocaulus viviparus]|uniref:Uncharacterized protein n=1 Tax=Dictyocaulus viviparus TaxID=29172 RepID=A0A0D8XP56_DICVI|nr:hypothetical protein DICVIV_08410 [Dictyocaulus viviparus]
MVALLRLSYELYFEEITMDAALRKSLFFLLYFDMAVLTTLLCFKKRTKISSEKYEPPRRTPFILKPKKIGLNPKEELIKDGLQTGRYAYPTFDDVKSDWSDREKMEKEKKSMMQKKSSVYQIARTQSNSKPVIDNASVSVDRDAPANMSPLKTKDKRKDVEKKNEFADNSK